MEKRNRTTEMTPAAARCIRNNPWLDWESRRLVIEAMARKVRPSDDPRNDELDEQLDLVLELDE